MTTTASARTAPQSRRTLNVTLWVLQILLAIAFAMTGLMKLTQPVADLATQMAWVGSVPAALVRFIGIAELAGAVGLILPALTRVQPRLTALAALGLVVVMLLASVTHASRGEFGMIPVNLVLGALAAFVAWGRGKAAPIGPRTA
jgi:putative oxidoreductase